jgi:hypothetical protein
MVGAYLTAEGLRVVNPFGSVDVAWSDIERFAIRSLVPLASRGSRRTENRKAAANRCDPRKQLEVGREEARGTSGQRVGKATRSGNARVLTRVPVSSVEFIGDFPERAGLSVQPLRRCGRSFWPSRPLLGLFCRSSGVTADDQANRSAEQCGDSYCHAEAGLIGAELNDSDDGPEEHAHEGGAAPKRRSRPVCASTRPRHRREDI